jgi:hypothetical protein
MRALRLTDRRRLVLRVVALCLLIAGAVTPEHPSREEPVSKQFEEQFQEWLEETYKGDERFAGVHGASGAGAGIRLEAAAGSHYEVAVRPAERSVRVGFLTTDRAVNEAIEQGILDSGDTLDDLMEVELDDLGEAPAPMEHFFERPTFCYTTALPLAAPEELGSSELRRRVAHLIDACYALFQEYLDE